ncbi:hypothetical protein [Streptomyces wuyuanensis]
MSELQSPTRRSPEGATALGRTWRPAAAAAAGSPGNCAGSADPVPGCAG